MCVVFEIFKKTMYVLAAPINIFRLTKGQMTMWNVKDVICSD